MAKFIRQKQHDILVLLHKYRGLTNDQIRQFLYSHLESNTDGQKANVSRFVSDLRKKKLIKTAACYPFTKEYIHYLSDKGIEYVNSQFVVDPLHRLSGFDNIIGDFEESLLSPPFKNIEHHMMFVEFCLEINKINADYRIRHNLYCVKEYAYLLEVGHNRAIKKTGKVRPDGELLVVDGKKEGFFAIEIDTGTERFELLVKKFQNYKKYFDYQVENGKSLHFQGILFFTKNHTRSLPFEKDIRWQTIINAAKKGLDYYFWKVKILGLNKTSSFNLVKAGLLDDLPPKENPVYENVKRKKEEELRKKKEEEAFSKAFQEELNQARKKEEQEKRRLAAMEEQRKQQELERERKNKRFFGLGKYFK